MKKITRIIPILLILSLMLGMFSACSTPSSNTSVSPEATDSASVAKDASSSGPYKIAVAVPLTGGSAENGIQTRNSLRLAFEEVNAAGGVNGNKVELVEFDDQADPKQAATVANAIAADTNILAVVGHIKSSCTLAGAAIYNNVGVPQITHNSSAPSISDAGIYTFRLWNSDLMTAKFHIDTIIKKGFKNVGVLYENNDYGLGAYGVAKENLAKANIPISVAESFLLNETKDFTTVLTKMKSAGVDAIFAVAEETELPMIARQAHGLNYYPFITSTGAYSSNVLKLGGKDVEGIYSATIFDLNSLPEAVSDYFDKYKARYGEDAAITAAACTAYMTGNLLIDALKSGATTREAIRNYLEGRTFDTMVGKLTFDENGDVTIPLTRMVIKDGKFVRADD